MEIPPSIQEYLEKGPFKVFPSNPLLLDIDIQVIDVPGSDEVTLTRQYGSETYSPESPRELTCRQHQSPIQYLRCKL